MVITSAVMMVFAELALEIISSFILTAAGVVRDRAEWPAGRGDLLTIAVDTTAGTMEDAYQNNGMMIRIVRFAKTGEAPVRAMENQLWDFAQLHRRTTQLWGGVSIGRPGIRKAARLGAYGVVGTAYANIKLNI